MQVVLLAQIGVAEGDHAAADKARLLDRVPVRIAQAGRADTRRTRADPEVHAQGVLRVQVHGHHRFAQALQTAAQRSGQGTATHATIDRHQRHHAGTPHGLVHRLGLRMSRGDVRGKRSAVIHGNAAKKMQPRIQPLRIAAHISA